MENYLFQIMYYKTVILCDSLIFNDVYIYQLKVLNLIKMIYFIFANWNESIFHHEDSWAVEQVAPGVSVVSSGGFQDQIGERPEQHGLTSELALLWAGGWMRELLRLLPDWIILDGYRLFEKDGLEQEGGGVTLYVREKRGCVELCLGTADEPVELVSQDYQADWCQWCCGSLL